MRIEPARAVARDARFADGHPCPTAASLPNSDAMLDQFAGSVKEPVDQRDCGGSAPRCHPPTAERSQFQSNDWIG